ncbi:hypothetical protein [Ideonella sp. BN130291]|uniref:hypothetical protein n=1 Tax=Ideonella sp. BN130291 TaxID=3112940 RepID=UPI002E26A633|nr:hypothetical protein [Ideonella sp. BN130291]
MSRLLQSIFRFLNRDLTGKIWQSRKTHPYSGEMTYFGSKDPAPCYWEAELSVPGQTKKIGVTMQGTPAGPEPSEEAFCRAILSDLDALFKQCQAAFAPIFAQWARQPVPQVAWREAFVLDGFEIPTQGNPAASWEVCYFVEPANHHLHGAIRRWQGREHPSRWLAGRLTPPSSGHAPAGRVMPLMSNVRRHSHLPLACE